MLSHVTVLGAGAWGTALAMLLSKNGHQTFLWGHRSAHIASMRQTNRSERYLPNIELPVDLILTDDLKTAVTSSKDIIVAVPSSAFAPLMQQLAAILCPEDITYSRLTEDAITKNILIATKGLEPNTHELLHIVTKKILGPMHNVGVLSGPSFALEVAKGLPTAVTIASEAITDDISAFAENYRDKLHNDFFRIYLSHDVVGVEICGAVKNVLAIAAGISEGLGLGANALAALVTRGLAEMTRLGLAMGAKANTFTSLAGIGDLVLTCTNNLSRNRRFGMALGQGLKIEEAIQTIGQVVEGFDNTKQVFLLAKEHQVEMPIVAQVYNVLMGEKSPAQAVKTLLTRSPSTELG